MKIDMHTHCLPVSRCAHHVAELLPDMFREASVDAIVLTNHCSPYHCDVLGETHEKQAMAYINTYRRCKKIGDSIFIPAEQQVQIHDKAQVLYSCI